MHALWWPWEPSPAGPLPSTEGTSAPLTAPEQQVSKESQNCRGLHLFLQDVRCKPDETLASAPFHLSSVARFLLQLSTQGLPGSEASPCSSWQLPILTSLPAPLPPAAGGMQPEVKLQRVLRWRQSEHQGCTPHGSLCKASTGLWGNTASLGVLPQNFWASC